MKGIGHLYTSVLVALLLLQCSASSQTLHLSTGESFSYEFQTLPFNNLLPYGTPANVGYFGMSFPLGGDLLTTGESVRMEWFENTLQDVPTASVTRSGTNNPTTEFAIPQANMWQDLQGAVRVTVISGEIDLDNLLVAVVRDFDKYGQTVPVPEPGTMALGAVASLIAFYSLLRRAHSRQRRSGPWFRRNR